MIKKNIIDTGQLFWALLICVMVIMAGCSNPDRKAAPEKLQGVVLILLDTIRSDHLSCYGYDRKTSPNIDALAQKGVRFKLVVSNSPWTLPSVGSLLTAEYPKRSFDNKNKLRSSLVEEFQKEGFSTAAVTEGGFVSRQFAMDRGFSYFEEEEGPVQVLKAGQQRTDDFKGGIERTFGSAKKWLKQHKDERFFLFIHTYEPHIPYTNHKFTKGMNQERIGPVFTFNFLNQLRTGRIKLTDSEVEYVKALYDGDIANSDRMVGDFITFLKDIELDDRTLVVVTSDHGEELNDHYPANTGDHGHSLRDPLVLVPLIIFDPVNAYPVKDVSAQVRLFDIIPTIAELFEMRNIRPTTGTSLLSLMNGEDTKNRIAVLGNTKFGPLRIGIRTGEYKYITVVQPDKGPVPINPQPPKYQLYDLSVDPGEKNNIVYENPELTFEMSDLLEKEKENISTKIEPVIKKEIDPAALERLKSLGYIQ